MKKDGTKESINYILEQKTIVKSKMYMLGIELMIHKGGRICYGLLKANISPYKEDNCVKISIRYTKKNEEKYKNSMLLEDEFVYKGLLEEFVEQIKESINQVIEEKGQYPRYHISFEEAANCEVGSSPMIFGIIAQMIMEIVYEDEIEKIFDMDIDTFTKKYVKKMKMQY